MRNFVKKYYRIVFQPDLLKGVLFLLLFVSGVVRYRFALVFVLGGLVSIVRQLLETKGVQTRKARKPIYQVLLLMFIMAGQYDIRYGQLYPKYPDFPVWVSIVSAAAVYCLGFFMYMKDEWLVRKLSGGEVFSICPNCGFANIQVVEQCKNCGYKYGMQIEPLAREAEIPDVLNKEIEEYWKEGLLRKVPQDVLIGLKLSVDEHVLMAMRTGIFYYIGTQKNNGRKLGGWFVMTTKRIICYNGLKGWESRNFIPYDGIKNIDIVKGKVAYTYKDYLKINAGEDSYQFLFGVSTRKLCIRIFMFDTTNAPILRAIMNCIDKRRQGMAQLVEFNNSSMDALDILTEPTVAAGKSAAFYVGSFLFAPMAFLALYVSGVGWRLTVLFSMAGRFCQPTELIYFLMVPFFGAWLAFRGYTGGLQNRMDKWLATLFLIICLVFNAAYAFMVASDIMHW